MLDYNILMLVHPSCGEHTFYKVKDANHIILIDSFGNEPQKEDKKNYILKRYLGCYINRFINNPKMKAEKFVFKNLVLTLHL